MRTPRPKSRVIKAGPVRWPKASQAIMHRLDAILTQARILRSGRRTQAIPGENNVSSTDLAFRLGANLENALL